MKPARILVLLTMWQWHTCAQTDSVACGSCHEDQVAAIQRSQHAALTCQHCHAGVGEFPHAEPLTQTPCQACHREEQLQFEKGAHGHALAAGNAQAPGCIACHRDVHEVSAAARLLDAEHLETTCGRCHATITKEFIASLHGQAQQQGKRDAPTCTTCHGAHANQGFKTTDGVVSPSQVRDTCADCHGNVRLAQRNRLPLDRVTSFDRSFHGLSARAGSVTAANCASCHGVHHILPSTDPRSSIHVSNLPRTCGQCHPQVSQQFATAATHWLEGENEAVPVRWVRQIYLTLIPLTIGLMTIHNLGDFVRKWLGLVRNRLRPSSQTRATLRMLPVERVLHGLLAVSFLVLVWSGFALRYPDLWISRPLLWGEAQWSLRGMAHRAAAVVLVAVSVAHVVTLCRKPRLREHWRELWPRPQDFREAWWMFTYNVGLRRQRPLVSTHSYVEKVEYWAVVWGTGVMALTGFLLWADRFTFAWLPRAWVDAAAALHFYEAVLASLAILVWHFYFVIFDPEVYPVDSAWLNGVSSRRPLQTEPPQVSGD